MNQPYLHADVCVLNAPLQAWSQRDGQLTGQGAQGVYVGDERVLSRLLLEVAERTVEPTCTHVPGGPTARFHAIVRTPEYGVDPAMWLQRTREVSNDTLTETISVRSSATVETPLGLVIRLVPDTSTMEQIKQGLAGAPVDLTTLAREGEGLVWSWRDDSTKASLAGPFEVEGSELVARVTVLVPPRGEASFSFTLSVTDTGAPFGATTAAPLELPETRSETALDRLLTTSLRDLNGLRMAEPDRPDDAFFAAGSPWYFTLFGRDSLISARLVLDHDPSIAASTLRVLSRRQGTATNVDTAEQPGKILHEVRRVTLNLDQTTSLPPEYFGTIDATPLWIMLLVDLAATGEDVREFEPALRAALTWLRDHSDADGDGFLEYRDESGHGLANQGWKDSGDSIRWADGSEATAPIALCEVQGYAHAAAVGAAGLLENWGDDDAAVEWREWAEALNRRFREHFWVADDLGAYPALALDADKRPVDGVASNMGHLLGTGILTSDEARTVVDRLLHESMSSGYGIRTLSTTNAGYWPMGYHVGSVWTHDTAFIIDGMLREGFTDEAEQVAAELLRAAEGFEFRMPELYGGQPSTEIFPPHPYPASCRPQAWAAASAIVVARALAD
ncbi:glycogen debranching N-terminal domain-containing protein [Aestuariimicrobium kwangyangense]|uniref:glycogen debranching N-terminal domain-containing protein n=1 Tax=Aestuariimicrobium kwangyangense TaxID=396389 RepID=UPI0003B45844|nr:glycogen debranching N-terminal domain-containing protein [Aestuariimicrobium kwangyangense]